MRYFIDHNIMVVAIAHVGWFESTNDIIDTPATRIPEVEAVRHILREVDNGRATVVYSDTCLETLYRALIAGGGDFEASDSQSALDAVEVLRVLSKASGGFVSDDVVRSTYLEAKTLVGAHFGKGQGQIDDEDCRVIANALAADADLIVTNDGGFFEVAGNLSRRNLAVLRPGRFNRVAKAA